MSTLIHIGFHKSGTTFLQRNYFGNNESVFHLVNRKQITKYFIAPTPFHYNNSETKEFIERNKREARDSEILTISNERLSGSPHTGDSSTPYIADRLKSALPNSKVIIVIREQRDMILSSYSQYLKARGSYNIEEYLMPPGGEFFRLNSLKYHYIISHYQMLFGSDKVLVLPFELLKTNSNQFIELINTFLELSAEKVKLHSTKKENTKLKPTQLVLKKYFNPFILRDFHNTGGTFYMNIFKPFYRILNYFVGKCPTRVLDTRIENKWLRVIDKYINDRYTDSNRITEKLINEDLKQYGYQ